jgi:hypothetical protein
MDPPHFLRQTRKWWWKGGKMKEERVEIKADEGKKKKQIKVQFSPSELTNHKYNSTRRFNKRIGVL